MIDFLCDCFLKMGIFNHCALPIVLVLLLGSCLTLFFIPKAEIASFAVVCLALTLGMSAFDKTYLELLRQIRIEHLKTEVRVQQLEDGRIHRVDAYVVDDKGGTSTRLKKAGE